MPGDLRSVPRDGVRPGTGGTMLVAVLLVAVVILAAGAGIGGTSHFPHARWVPHYVRPKPTYGGTYIPGPGTAGGHSESGGAALPIWLVVIAAVIVVVVLAVLAVFTWRWWRDRGLAPAAETAESPLHVMTGQGTAHQAAEAELELEPERLLTGIELALEVLDQGLEPADAVVRAWLGLQETAQESGIVRRKAETPTEFTARILGRVFVDDRAVRTLLRLYLRARFGDHPVTVQDVTEVREALRQLVSSWQPSGGAPVGRAR